MKLAKYSQILLTCALVWAISPSAFAQVAGANQGIFQDEAEMQRMNNSQIQQLQSQEQGAEAQAAADDQKNQTYRLYAEKRIQELEKLKGPKANNDKQILVLQNWLKSDAQMRANDQQTIQSLRAQIANLQRSQQRIIANMGNDINSMRQSVQDQRDDVKFQQMMQINQFNELQSEMGAASWGRPPTDGTFNSVGGYGFGGGYGYGFGGGRRAGW